MDTIIRGAVAPAGFFACLELQSVNAFVSLLVGVATITFLALSIYKLIKELKSIR
tara:strand:- start:15 stop:179 length:165 start_codon:yes stop_codon:yes gene_type:complete